MPAVEYRMDRKIVIFCKFRERRHAGSGGILVPGGIWTCTNPSGHCSCVSTCGIASINRMGHSADGIGLGVNHDSDKGERREIHPLSA